MNAIIIFLMLFAAFGVPILGLAYALYQMWWDGNEIRKERNL